MTNYLLNFSLFILGWPLGRAQERNEPQQLYWRTDIVQLTRYYMIEAARSGIRLSPRRAGFPV
jgi:hypothetical protein